MANQPNQSIVRPHVQPFAHFGKLVPLALAVHVERHPEGSQFDVELVQFWDFVDHERGALWRVVRQRSSLGDGLITTKAVPTVAFAVVLLRITAVTASPCSGFSKFTSLLVPTAMRTDRF